MFPIFAEMFSAVKEYVTRATPLKTINGINRKLNKTFFDFDE